MCVHQRLGEPQFSNETTQIDPSYNEFVWLGELAL